VERLMWQTSLTKTTPKKPRCKAGHLCGLWGVIGRSDSSQTATISAHQHKRGLPGVSSTVHLLSTDSWL
jgi:hypothetical protein